MIITIDTLKDSPETITRAVVLLTAELAARKPLDPEDSWPEAAALSTEERRLAQDGLLVNAIKTYRARTGAGLFHAKVTVEAYIRRRSGGTPLTVAPEPADVLTTAECRLAECVDYFLAIEMHRERTRVDPVTARDRVLAYRTAKNIR